MMFRTVVLATLITAPALADPPPRGSEDYEQLMPYAPWISRQATNAGGGLCCSIADCRVVPWRTHGGAGYEAFIASTDDRGFTKFVNGTNAWIAVPAAVIKRIANPTGRAIACWSHDHLKDGGYYCFFLPDLT